MFDTETTYEVITFSVGDTKAGTKMGKLLLKDSKNDSTLNCVLWEEALNRMDSKLFRNGNLVRVVSGSYNEKFNNCLISALELVKEAKLGLDKSEQNRIFNEILGYVDKFSNPKLKSFIQDYFKENEEKIKTAPAAKRFHHNYLGGLLVHTLECLEFAKANMAVFVQTVDAETVYAACILHDIGKIFEYDIDTETGLIDKNDVFLKEWVSHSQYGYSLCMMNGFKTVGKMIAAHHGRKDWGAIVDLENNDLEPIYYLMHHIDDLSAKFGRTNVGLLESAQKQQA